MADYAFDDDDDQDDSTPVTDSQNKAPNPVRVALRKAEKEAKDLRAQLAEARKQIRVPAVREAFKQLGLAGNPDVLVPDSVDPSVEGVRSWAIQAGLLVPEAQDVQTDISFVPISSQAAIPGNLHQLTRDQYRTLLTVDPEAALQAVAEGRVIGLNKN